MENIIGKLEALRALVQAKQKQGLLDKGYTLEFHPHEVRIKVGRKYANIDVGGPHWSGCYMVELDTGNIYGIKAYGVIHRGHAYGTLETINDYDWRGYRAVRTAQRVAA